MLIARPVFSKALRAKSGHVLKTGKYIYRYIGEMCTTACVVVNQMEA